MPMDVELFSLASAVTTVRILDLCGVFAFAALGGLSAAQRGLDLFGVLVIAFVTACAGGIARDVLIGAVPPAAFRDGAYLAIALIAGWLAFIAGRTIQRGLMPLRLLDAAGLALFSVAGAQKALLFGLEPVMAALMGVLTGIGGGIARDVLLARVPEVFKPTEIYALAALAGSGCVAVAHLLALPQVPSAVGGALVCFAIRLLAMARGWRLPAARWRESSGTDDSH